MRSERNKIKVLQLATSSSGGAGLASINLNNMFNNERFISQLVVKNGSTKFDNVIILENHLLFLTRIKSFFKKFVIRIIYYLKNFRTDPKYYFYNFYETRLDNYASDILKLLAFKPDIIIIHWVSNFLNAKSISDLANLTNAKLLWVMMDNSPITGGCHYPWDCQGYSINCEKCPALSNNAFNWLPELNLRFKKNWLPKNLLFIACSESDLNRGCKSILSKNKIEKIYLPVDSNKFFPSEKGLSKLYFNIPANKQVILYGSLNINEERKGGRLFIESLRLLERKLTLQQIDNIIILVAGNSSELEKSFFNNNTNFQIKYTGHLSEECLIKAYQAAQIFVSTSIEDSGPFMVNQALMCGTPVVAFKSGVAVDLCDSKIFGCIVDLYDVEKLSIGMLKFLKLNKEEYEMAAIHCRISAVEKFSFSSTIKRYESVLNLKDCEYKR